MKKKSIINLFHSEEKCSFGVDFSGSYLRMLKIKFNNKDCDVLGWVEKRMPKGIIEENKIIKKEEFRDIFKETLDNAKGDLSGSKVMISIPEEKVFTSVVEIPLIKKEASLEETVKWETESNIPVAIEDIYYDWQIIAQNEEKMEILIMAADKDTIDNYLEVFDDLGFKVVALEPESLSITRSLITEEEKKKYDLLINIGTGSSNFVICRGKVPLFTSISSISGRMLTEVIVKELGISFDKAERYKIKKGLDCSSSDDSKNIFDPVLKMLMEEINKTVEFLGDNPFLNEKENKIDKIILCGGGSNLKGLESYLTVKLKQPVSQSNPWVNLNFNKKIPPISKDKSQSFVSVIGLVLKFQENEND